MLNSGVTANLVLAVLFIAVQARSIQNQGKLNCFSADLILVSDKANKWSYLFKYDVNEDVLSYYLIQCVLSKIKLNLPNWKSVAIAGCAENEDPKTKIASYWSKAKTHWSKTNAYWTIPNFSIYAPERKSERSEFGDGGGVIFFSFPTPYPVKSFVLS